MLMEIAVYPYSLNAANVSRVYFKTDCAWKIDCSQTIEQLHAVYKKN